MTRKERILKDANEALVQALKIAGRVNENPALVNVEDIHSLRAAATQARQATMYLDQLLGMLEGELP